LTDEGKKVIIRIQPFIYHKIKKECPEFIKAIADAGCWGFMTEGLKIRISMPKAEQEIMQKIGDYFGFNIREFYKQEHNKCGSDYELSIDKKDEILNMMNDLAEKHGLKFFNGDNHINGIGSRCECCGTEVLRNYKTLGCDLRSRVFDSKSDCKLKDCKVTFTRQRKNKDKTIKQVCDEYANNIKETITHGKN